MQRNRVRPFAPCRAGVALIHRRCGQLRAAGAADIRVQIERTSSFQAQVPSDACQKRIQGVSVYCERVAGEAAVKQ